MLNELERMAEVSWKKREAKVDDVPNLTIGALALFLILGHLFVRAASWSAASASATAHLSLHLGNSVTKVKYLTGQVPIE